jgi:hypothetical protein
MWRSKGQVDDLCVARRRQDHENPAGSCGSLAQKYLPRFVVKPGRPQILRGHARRLHGLSDITMAVVSSALAPAILMAAIWHDPGIAPMVFAFTLVIALSHAVVLGLPIFLILQFRGLTSITASVVVGFAIGVVPASLLTFPPSSFALCASASAGRAFAADVACTTAIWVGYVRSLIYLGLLGALGALVFWLVLMPEQNWKPRGLQRTQRDSAAPYQMR